MIPQLASFRSTGRSLKIQNWVLLETNTFSKGLAGYRQGLELWNGIELPKSWLSEVCFLPAGAF